MNKIIFDFGANEGQNIPYYLSKSDIVVCVEANPRLAKAMCKKFIEPIREKKLFIENIAVVGKINRKKIDFYLNIRKNQLSSVIKPKHKNYSVVKVKSRSITEILEKYLTKNMLFYYAKFDLEGYDAVVINAMFEDGFYPINISIEAGTPEGLAAIKDTHKYLGFKLQEGHNISRYTNLRTSTKNGWTYTRFSPHSAGPMGEDIPSPWLTIRSIMIKLKVVGYGWKDIHASMLPSGEPRRNRFSDLFIGLIIRISKTVKHRLKSYLLS